MKNKFFALAGLLLTITLFNIGTRAQDMELKPVNGGILNGRAISLPKPQYPIEAREAKAEAVVAVNVTIDETGAVISAIALSEDQRHRQEGDTSPIPEVHPALRQAAETAALNAKFSVTQHQPVKVTGRILYNFVLANHPPEFDVPGKKTSGGVLNGKAISLPAPIYPSDAAETPKGAVSVQVIVDEAGNVIAAQAVSGHPLLRPAATAAAREAKFNPTFLSGEPVKVTGVLTYNFAP